jgi:hypothetical protein
MKDIIIELVRKYSSNLKSKIDERICEMKNDDNSHYLIYKVLGISNEEGRLIDIYQNKGRFLYNYAGLFLQEAVILCFKMKFRDAKIKVKVPNKASSRPRSFEIDCLIDNDAYEIKWRDATTDGDHITKEHTRLKNISNLGYHPIRIMFYMPNREQSIRIQETIKTIYTGIGGEYYSGDEAWTFIQRKTDIDLKGVLESIADEDQNSF